MATPRQIALITAILGLATVPTVAVVALVLSAQVATTPSGRLRQVTGPVVDGRVSPTPAATTCTRTVAGFTTTAVHAARDAAGAGTVCFPAGTYAGDLALTVAGQRWQLDPAAKLTGFLAIRAAGATLSGGIVERPTANPWGWSINVDADDVTIQGVAFRGGGVVINVLGNDRTRILDNDFSGQTGPAVAIWGDGIGADDTLISGNTIIQTATSGVSPVISRGSETVPYTVWNRRTIVRNNVIDQGTGTRGWFGVEFARSPNSLIEGNTIRGGQALISFPEADGSIVRNNRLEITGTAYWGIEIANSDDVTVENNTFVGDGGGAAVSMNSGSLRARVVNNSASSLNVLVEMSGDYNVVTGNICRMLANLVTYTIGPNTVIRDNGPCS